VSRTLTVLAGPDALAELRDGGLVASRVRALIGASGGPKWLTLYGLDRVLFPWLLENLRQPLHTLGSSIGSWRFACFAASSPRDALERLADAYIEQRYGPAPTPAEVSEEARRMLDVLLGPEGTAPQIAHSLVRMHVVTARFRHLGAREDRSHLAAFALAALANVVHRRTLGAFVERVVFDAHGDPGPFAPWRDVPTRHVPLSEANLRAALLASGSIPAVMAGVRDPHAAPAGMYRDGGVTDYHFGREIDPDDGIALYPHFYTRLTTGWFDKSLPWRRTRGLRRVVVIAPSDAHVASLPHGRIPDRVDFERMSDAERIRAWREALALGSRLGDELGELLASGKLGAVARPLP